MEGGGSGSPTERRVESGGPPSVWGNVGSEAGLGERWVGSGGPPSELGALAGSGAPSDTAACDPAGDGGGGGGGVLPGPAQSIPCA